MVKRDTELHGHGKSSSGKETASQSYGRQRQSNSEYSEAMETLRWSANGMVMAQRNGLGQGIALAKLWLASQRTAMEKQSSFEQSDGTAQTAHNGKG